MEPTFFFMTALRLLFNCCTIYICTLDVCNIGYVEVSNNFSLIFSTTFRCKVTELASNALQVRIVPGPWSPYYGASFCFYSSLSVRIFIPEVVPEVVPWSSLSIPQSGCYITSLDDHDSDIEMAVLSINVHISSHLSSSAGRLKLSVLIVSMLSLWKYRRCEER